MIHSKENYSYSIDMSKIDLFEIDLIDHFIVCKKLTDI